MRRVKTILALQKTTFLFVSFDAPKLEHRVLFLFLFGYFIVATVGLYFIVATVGPNISIAQNIVLTS